RPIFVEQPVRWPVGPDVRFRDWPDCASLDEFRQPAGSFRSLSLVSHLRSHFVLASRFGNSPRFPDGMRQRLLATNMFAMLHRSHAHKRVQMIGRADNHSIDSLLLVEHLAKISINFRIRELLEHSRGMVAID